MTPLRIYIGYDPREAIAYHVLSQSIMDRASEPVTITPLARSTLLGIHKRERGPLDSTDFSITRFLVPYLSDYSGISIYMDCDMLCKADIWKLAALREPGRSVSVVKHDYKPTSLVKMDGQIQTAYQRKNWSSLMVFDNHACWGLTPEYVNAASGLALHQFEWLQYHRIGSLPLEWNWLVGEYAHNPNAKLLHYTLGGPWFDHYPQSEHNSEWITERFKLMPHTEA